MMNETPKFPVGTEFKTRGKGARVCKVVDYLVTRNLKGEIVRTEYVEEHQFLGQTIRSNVCETTVAIGVKVLNGTF